MMSIQEYERLNHSVWECKYHIVFIPKFRKKAFFGALRREIGPVLRKLALQKGWALLHKWKLKREFPQPQIFLSGFQIFGHTPSRDFIQQFCFQENLIGLVIKMTGSTGIPKNRFKAIHVSFNL